MSPNIALLLCTIFVIISLIIDKKVNKYEGTILYIPFLWFFIISTRPASFWFISRGNITTSSYAEGDPLNRLILLVLIILGLICLRISNVKISKIVSENKLVFIWFIFCLISIIWSDTQSVALRRYIKSLGTPIMVLIILSHKDIEQSLKFVFNKLAYIAVPFSLLTMKYFPAIGRVYQPWGGPALNTGITSDKNALGRLCMVCILFIVWNLTKENRIISGLLHKFEKYLQILYLILMIWLLITVNSATAIITSGIGVLFLLILRNTKIRNSLKQICITIFILTLLMTPLLLIYSDVLVQSAIESTGHSNTFWGRTVVWKELLELHEQPLLGTGFRSYWSEWRLERLWDIYWWRPNQAHNGYLEIYLEFGMVGVFFISLIIYSTFRKLLVLSLNDFDVARIYISLLVVILLYNITESGFRPMHTIWFLFLIISIHLPQTPNQASNS